MSSANKIIFGGDGTNINTTRQQQQQQQQQQQVESQNNNNSTSYANRSLNQSQNHSLNPNNLTIRTSRVDTRPLYLQPTASSRKHAYQFADIQAALGLGFGDRIAPKKMAVLSPTHKRSLSVDAVRNFNNTRNRPRSISNPRI